MGISRVSHDGLKMLRADGTVSRCWRRKLVTGSRKKMCVNRTLSLLSGHWVLLGSQVGFSNLRKKETRFSAPLILWGFFAVFFFPFCF